MAAGASLLAALLATPCHADPRDTFDAQLVRHAGRAATQCGLFKLDDPAPAGWQCAQAAERAGRPYWFAFFGPGEDSMVGIAAIRTPTGAHVVLEFDSDPNGGNADHPQVRTTACPVTFGYEPGRWPRFPCIAK